MSSILIVPLICENIFRVQLVSDNSHIKTFNQPNVISCVYNGSVMHKMNDYGYSHVGGWLKDGFIFLIALNTV